MLFFYFFWKAEIRNYGTETVHNRKVSAFVAIAQTALCREYFGLWLCGVSYGSLIYVIYTLDVSLGVCPVFIFSRAPPVQYMRNLIIHTEPEDLTLGDDHDRNESAMAWLLTQPAVGVKHAK